MRQRLQTAMQERVLEGLILQLGDTLSQLGWVVSASREKGMILQDYSIKERWSFDRQSPGAATELPVLLDTKGRHFWTS